MIIKFSLNMLALMIILLTITSCSFDNNTPIPIVESISPLSTPVTPTPAPTATITPTSTITVPQAKADFGAVYGQILGKKGQPLKDMKVRLGKIEWIEGQKGQEGLVMSDRVRSPQAMTDENGYFIIENIPPDEYGIVVDDIYDETPFFISELSSEKLKVIDIKAKSVLLLGKFQLDVHHPQ